MSGQMDLFPSSSESFEDFLGISGLGYHRGFLDPAQQERLLQEIDSQPWRGDLKRRVQHYGYRYDYKARRVDPSMYLGVLPEFVAHVAKTLVDRKLVSKMPDQAIVNEYVPGQGISAHVDCEPCFADTIVTVSLGWAYEMEFSKVKAKDERHAILLEPGSALIMRGEARYNWLHEIKARKSDRGVERKRRVSLTFRNVLVNTCDIAQASAS